MRAIFHRNEPEDVYRELTEGLADNVVPMVMLCGIMVSTGVYVMSIVFSLGVLLATTFSAIASLVKIAFILHHQRHRLAYRSVPLESIHRTEKLHAATTIAVCVSAGLLSASIFRLPQPVLHLIPVCIAFGYGAGLIARVSIRPHIAAAALVGILLPGAIAMASMGGQHLFVSAITTIFTAAGLQSIAFVYETAKRAVTLRLQMESLARHDPLTGLLNRLGLRESVEVLSCGEDREVAVHAFDLDGFKAINDAFGHAAGDRLLKILADRVQSIVPKGSIVARTGGDEFILVQLGDEEAAHALATLIHGQLTQPCDIGGARLVTVGLSLGFAASRLSQASLGDLMHEADAQSYAIKRDGGGILGGEWPYRRLSGLAATLSTPAST